MRWIVLLALIAAGCLAAVAALGLVVRSPFAGLIMLGVAMILFWFAWRLFETEARMVIFDGERLIDDSGVELCRLDQIKAVDRGLAVWKPTGGFVVTLNAPLAWDWSPGLWWRMGRRIGVGGATPGKAGTAMAEAIAVAMAEAKQQG